MNFDIVVKICFCGKILVDVMMKDDIIGLVLGVKRPMRTSQMWDQWNGRYVPCPLLLFENSI